MKLVKWGIVLLVLAAAVWFIVEVPVGEKSLYEHGRALVGKAGAEDELDEASKALGKKIGRAIEKGKEEAGKLKDKVVEGGKEQASRIKEAVVEKVQEEITDRDREELKEIIEEKKDQ